MKEQLLKLLQNKWTQIGLALFIGIAIGAIFYPNKTSEEKIREEARSYWEQKVTETQNRYEKMLAEEKGLHDTEIEQHIQRETEDRMKIESLTQENSSLKQSMKKRKFKLVKPDGTIIEKEMEESNTESQTSVITSVKQEFERKVKEIEDRWKKVHEERVKTLITEHKEELQKARSEVKTVEIIKEVEKKVEVNKKRLRPEIGYSSDREVYFHSTYTLWGPIFIGGGVSGTDKRFGEGRIGIGIEF